GAVRREPEAVGLTEAAIVGAVNELEPGGAMEVIEESSKEVQYFPLVAQPGLLGCGSAKRGRPRSERPTRDSLRGAEPFCRPKPLRRSTELSTLPKETPITRGKGETA